MQLAAAQTASDYELQRGGIANSGTVEAVAPLAGRRDQYVVVTRERRLPPRRPPTRVCGRPGTLRSRRSSAAHGRWVVSRWQPEN